MALNEKVRTQVKTWLDDKKISTESSQRSKMFEEFCKKHENDKLDPLNFKKHRTIFTNELRKELVRRNIDPVTFGLTRPRNSDNKFHQEAGGLNPQIQPSPKQRRADSVSNNNPNVLQSKNQQAQGINPAQQVQQNPQNLDPNAPQMQEPSIPITPELVESTFETIGSLIKIKYPSFRKLSESDIKKLGSAWLPIFQEYLQFSYMKWGVPLFITAGVFLPRIADTKEEPEEKEQKSPNEKRSEDKTKSNSEGEGMTFAQYKKKLEGRTK